MLWDIDGEKFEIPVEIVDGILDAMQLTSNIKKETGFLGCTTPTGMKKGPMCVGTECSVELKGCKPAELNYHVHPTVISFSLMDYIGSLGRASYHPENKQLMCVALGTKAIRCKAVKKIPPPSFQMPDPYVDTEENRELVKPFFTKKVTITAKQLHELQSGTPWNQLSLAEEIVAIDEGEDVCAPSGKQCLLQQEGGATMAKKSLVEVAQEYIKPPSGKYPWETKTVTKSVATPFGVGLEMAGMPTLKSDVTEFVAAEDIEIPDKKLIHFGEAGQYIHALSPIILTQEKDANGKWKILDGRHRLVAWRASGYTRIPVVFSTDSCYKDAPGGGGSGGGGVIGFGGKDGCLGKHEEDEEE